MKPLLDLGDNGVALQIGHNEKAKTVIAHIRIANFCGDNEGEDKLCSCSTGNKSGFLCRICMCPDIHAGAWGGFTSSMTSPSSSSSSSSLITSHQDASFPSPWPRRDNNHLNFLCKEIDRIDKETFLRSLMKLRGSRSQPTDENELEILADAKKLNLRPGTNAFMDLPSFLTPREGLPVMVGPDPMHTLNGGTIKECIESIVCIIYALEELNRQKLMPTLDSMLITFPRKHSIIPFKLPHLKTGVSTFLPKMRAKTKDKNSGKIVGHIPLDEMPGILFQLVYCCNQLLPETLQELLNEDKEEFNDWQIRKIVYNAAHSAVDIVAILKSSEGYGPEDLQRLHHAIRLSNAHLFMLFCLKGDLNDMVNKIPLEKRTAHLSKIRKPHGLLHMAEFIEMFGDPKVFDTMDGEHSLISIKVLYERSVKNSPLTFLSMAKRAQLNDRIESFCARMKKQKLGHGIAVPEGHQYRVSRNAFKVDLRCIEKQNENKVIVATVNNEQIKSTHSLLHPLAAATLASTLDGHINDPAETDKEKQDIFKRFMQGDKACTLRALSMVSLERGEDSFIIYCDEKNLTNKTIEKDNQMTQAVFSTVEVRQAPVAEESAMTLNARVLGILQLRCTKSKAEYKEYIFLDVLYMEPIGSDKRVEDQSRNIHDKLYTYKGRWEDDKPNELDHQIVELDSVTRPVCMIPLYHTAEKSNKNTIFSYEEKLADFYGGLRGPCKQWQFLEVNIPGKYSKSDRWNDFDNRMVPLQSKEPSVSKFALQQADLQKIETFLNEYKNANSQDKAEDKLSPNEDEDDEDDENKDDDEESDEDDDDDEDNDDD